MAARAIGSGVISFGMVSIPVKMYSTVDTTKGIRFNMLRKDGARLKQQYVHQLTANWLTVKTESRATNSLMASLCSFLLKK